MIVSIIKIFEDDRSLIAREFVADDELRNGAARDRERAEELANKIIENSKSTLEFGIQIIFPIKYKRNYEL